jgi:riboflavin kinase/FMN adenylyltransferase
MKIYRTLPVFDRVERDRPIALALGHFDGVHIGHQAMLKRVVEAASDLRCVPSVLTFEPSPRKYFMKGDAPPRLTSLRMRLELMATLGIERVYVLPFDERLANLLAAEFCDAFLSAAMRVRWLLLSEESRFGKNREGSLAFLRKHGAPFSIETIGTVMIDGARVSSTRIREAISSSDFALAARLLGRPFSIAGRVRHGDARGRTLGFPTVNLPLKGKPPLAGVFAVRVRGLGSQPVSGVANLGYRPTVKEGEKTAVLETNLFDFNEDVYGRELDVEFVAKIRDEKKFAGLAELEAEIEKDKSIARKYLSAMEENPAKRIM